MDSGKHAYQLPTHGWMKAPIQMEGPVMKVLNDSCHAKGRAFLA